MILALKTPLVETIIGTKIDFLNQFNIFFTLFFPANFVQFNSSTGLILLFLPFFYNTIFPATPSEFIKGSIQFNFLFAQECLEV